MNPENFRFRKATFGGAMILQIRKPVDIPIGQTFDTTYRWFDANMQEAHEFLFHARKENSDG